MTGFKNRITGSGVENPKDLLANPENWRVHPQEQQKALTGVLEEVGWVQEVIVNQTTGHLIDGHLRVMVAMRREEQEIPVKYVDLTENEERIVLATIDPVAALATTDQDQLNQIITNIEARNDDLNGFLSELFEEPPEESTGAEEAKASLAEQFLVPPFTVLDGRQGYWLERKRNWQALGIKSELGRGADGDKTQQGMTYTVSSQPGAVYDRKAEIEARDGTKYTWNEFAEKYPEEIRLIGDSIFDPVLCEIAYLWFSPEGGAVLDPFAGGSVRGIVAAMSNRDYTGLELRKEQVEANRKNWNEINSSLEAGPEWITADSREMESHLPTGKEYDLVFSCPPYADLEVYSDDPADISNKDYHEFLHLYRDIIHKAVARLKNNRFAVWVIGDLRDKKGHYRNFVSDSIQAFKDAGMDLYNEAIYIQPTGSLAMRAGGSFRNSRKLGKGHQNMLVFLKGEPEGDPVKNLSQALAGYFEDTREMMEAHQKVLVFSKGDAKQATKELGAVAIAED